MHYKREEKAYRIHIEEADRSKAKIYNLGWGVSVEGNWISIASKTSKGLLQTNIDFDTDTTTHEWMKR
jgi:hypothetical protein